MGRWGVGWTVELKLNITKIGMGGGATPYPLLDPPLHVYVCAHVHLYVCMIAGLDLAR